MSRFNILSRSPPLSNYTSDGPHKQMDGDDMIIRKDTATAQRELLSD